MDLLISYLLLINALGFGLMTLDKHKARKKQWRIPERTLFLTALLGGSAGSLLAMYLVRHKTRHLTFTLGIPAILAAQLVMGYILLT